MEVTLVKLEEFSLFDEQKFMEYKQYDLLDNDHNESLIKSKLRVQNHGEVFTPKWMVQKMLSEPEIQKKLHDLHATFLEPSAGEGAFLKEIIHQKLNYVDEISNKTNWKENALWALMSIYAIELLEDNLIKAKRAMLEVFINHYQEFMKKKLGGNTDLYKSAKYIINVNIVQGNTLTFKNSENKLIEFSKWIPSGKKVSRSTFTYKSLFNNSDIDDIDANQGQMSLFGDTEVNTTNKNKLSLITKIYEEKNE